MSFISQLQKKSNMTSPLIPLSTGMFGSRWSSTDLRSSVQRQVEPEEDAVQIQRQLGMPDYASLVGNDPRAGSVPPAVQREAMPEEEEIQTKPLQRSADGSMQADSSIESRLGGSKGGGSPLPEDVRAFMEPRFGADFSGVRVHTGGEAVQMSRDLNAQAFTHGKDVYFGAGKGPGKDELTAHELTHVVQQDSITQSKNISQDLIQQQAIKDITNLDKTIISCEPIDLGETVIYSNETDPIALESIDLGETVIYSNETDANAEAKTVGLHPSQSKYGPYAHFSQADPVDFQTGLGLIHIEGDQQEKLDYVSVNGNIGIFGDPNKKNMRGGLKADAQLFNGTTGNNGFFGGSLGLDGGLFGANAEQSIGQDGFTFGAQSYVTQGGVRIGDVSKSEVNDEQLRVGGGVGLGASGRLHWGDQDDDGRKEIGFGFDAGPLSFDLKTEDPLLTTLKFFAPIAGFGTDVLTDDKKVNLTDATINLVNKAGNLVHKALDKKGNLSDEIANLVSKAGSTASNLTDKALNYLGIKDGED
jgi:hypothetical protein